MIKLKDLLKEWNNTDFKKLEKRWSKPVMAGREPDGLTEYERSGGTDKESLSERAFVDTNGTFEVKGYGGNNVFIKTKNLEITLSFKGDDLKDALNAGKGKGKVVMAGVKTND
tara:strand:+ start:190 stop:528 length:339 start_codon:yes stop_codon:yes gene_type:complete